jgi:hypothetical protein
MRIGVLVLTVSVETGKIRFGERFTVSFQRTLRIPDDGRTYPLPPGLGQFPVLKVADYLDRTPASWHAEPGVFIPMYQREALWLGFSAASWKPNAAKVAVGGVNALSGAPDDRTLQDNPQDYIVCPPQPWLDGVHTGPDSIRQFVAMPLGKGYTVESSLTGVETVGGIQITVFEPKPGRFPEAALDAATADSIPRRSFQPASRGGAMGIGAGGTMRQKIYADPYGVNTWDPANHGRMIVHIVNSAQFEEITGMEPPATPIDARAYTEAGFPWFDLYDEAELDIPATESLAQVRTIGQRDAELEEKVADQPSFDVPESQVKRLRRDDADTEQSQ